MARQVVTVDDVPWQLDAHESGVRLERVGGLDISFVESPAASTCTPSPDSASPAPRSAPAEGSARAAEASGHVGGRAGTQAGPRRGPPETAEAEAGEDSEAAAGAGSPGIAALVVLSFPDLRLLYEDYEPVDLSIPYLPGFLGFREAAAYATLLRRAEASPHAPQVLLVDGCGTLHPRGCGSACQVGVTCGYPAVGVAKNLLAVEGLDRLAVRRALQEAAEQVVSQAGLTASSASSGRAEGGPTCVAGAGALAGRAPGEGGRGESEGEASVSPTACSGHTAAASAPLATPAAPAQPRCGRGGGGGSGKPPPGPRDVQVPLVGSSGRVLGAALCPGGSRRALYISIGHRLSLASCVELVRRCCVTRMPEPMRQADLRSRQWLREHGAAAAAAAAAAGVDAAAAAVRQGLVQAPPLGRRSG